MAHPIARRSLASRSSNDCVSIRRNFVCPDVRHHHAVAHPLPVAALPYALALAAAGAAGAGCGGGWSVLQHAPPRRV
jgi:hypothetical protein